VRTVTATRYVAPLREGGSLPAVVEADDDGLYVVKFRGAGQGPKALVAELMGGEIARALGLKVPELVYIEVDPQLGRTEPDGEIQDLVKDSGGLNLALDFLPAALPFDPLLTPPMEYDLASAIVWLDAYISNVDRTARNTNMLMWHKAVWLIDHGASFYFQYREADFVPDAGKPFKNIQDHVLIRLARRLPDADARLAALLTPEVLREIVAKVPDAWLADDKVYATPELYKEAFWTYLTTRLQGPRAFAQEAIDAHTRRL
jgi:hypothetical protein